MTLWQNVETAAGMPGSFRWLIVGFILAVALLSYLRPAERLRMRNSVILFGLAFVCLFAAGAISFSSSHSAGTVYLNFRVTGLFVETVVIINMASFLYVTIILRCVRQASIH